MRAASRLVAYLLFPLFSIPAFAGDPIEDLEDVQVGVKLNGEQPTVAEVQAAILQAARARGWTPKLEGDGKIVASILVRGRHYAEVDIPFGATAYSIRYRTSRELDFKEPKRTIHGNYNKWVILLSREINQALGALPVTAAQ